MSLAARFYEPTPASLFKICIWSRLASTRERDGGRERGVFLIYYLEFNCETTSFFIFQPAIESTFLVDSFGDLSPTVSVGYNFISFTYTWHIFIGSQVKSRAVSYAKRNSGGSEINTLIRIKLRNVIG